MKCDFATATTILVFTDPIMCVPGSTYRVMKTMSVDYKEISQ